MNKNVPEQPEKMTATERQALSRLVNKQVRVAMADIERVAAERYAAWERQATARWSAQDLGVREFVAELNAELQPKIAELDARLEAYFDEHDIDDEHRARVFGGVELIESYYRRSNPGHRAELRRKKKAEIDEARKQAKVEVERKQAAIESRIWASAFISSESTELLAELPSAETLLPPLEITTGEEAGR